VVEDFISVNPHRQPVVVEAVHKVIATYGGLGQLPGAERERDKVSTSEHDHPIPDFWMQYRIDYAL